MSMVCDVLNVIADRDPQRLEHAEYIRIIKGVAVDADGSFDSLRNELLRRGLVRHNHTVELTRAGRELLEKVAAAQQKKLRLR